MGHVIGVVCLLLIQTVQSQVPDSLARIERIKSIVASGLSRQSAHVPGISAAVVKDNRVIWSGGFGFSDLKRYLPATSATKYRIASISKTITAIAVMKLLEQRRLDIDSLIQKYCPQFPGKQWPISVRSILAHMSGIRHYRNQEEFDSQQQFGSILESVGIISADTLLFEPGMRFSYSTYAFNLLGCAIENTSGKSFASFVRMNILEPCGMQETFAANEVAKNRQVAAGYALTKQQTLTDAKNAELSGKIPGGGLISTVQDLAKLCIGLYNGNLLKAETLKEMWTPQATKNGESIPYGLGWEIEDVDGLREVRHGGSQQGVTTLISLFPQKRIGVVLIMNRENAEERKILARQIAEAVDQ